MSLHPTKTWTNSKLASALERWADDAVTHPDLKAPLREAAERLRVNGREHEVWCARNPRNAPACNCAREGS